MCLLFLFFFFKQKTAYEMRISDWSSDVCSSDLLRVIGGQCAAPNDDHFGPRAFEMGMRTRRLAGNPAAAAIGKRDAAVERGRQLQRDMRSEIGRAACRERVCQYV